MATTKKKIAASKVARKLAQPNGRFLSKPERGHLEWFFNDSDAALARLATPSDPDRLELKVETRRGVVVGATAEDRGPGNVRVSSKRVGLAHEPPGLEQRVDAARRYQRVIRAFEHMKRQGLASCVEVLREGYALQDFIIEDGGEYEFDNEGETTFGSGTSAVKMRQKRAALAPKRFVVRAQPTDAGREELALSNGAFVTRGGHVMGSEGGKGEPPGLSRMAHPTARRNLAEALEYACRAYEAALSATADARAPKKRQPLEKKQAVISQKRASEYLKVTPARVSQMIKRGDLRTKGTKVIVSLQGTENEDLE